jgi:hypothetical protein
MCCSGRLFSIHGTGTCEQEFPGTGFACELQRTFRSANNRGECIQRSLGHNAGSCVGSSMDDVAELAWRESEASYVTGVKLNSGVRSKVRTLRRECRGVTGEHNHAGAEAESLIDVAKTLHEPAAKKAGSAGQQYAMAAHFLPQ